MARQKRLNLPGTVYHVITRGLNRMPIFKDNTEELLNRFGADKRSALRAYRVFVQDGWQMGKREDLCGGGLRRRAKQKGKNKTSRLEFRKIGCKSLRDHVRKPR